MKERGNFVLVIDVGTTFAKGVIFDENGTPVAITRKTYPMLTPRTDWAEQNPEAVLKGVLEAMKEVVQKKPVGVEIAAVSFSSQMYSILAIAADGRPLTNSLTWSDRRGAEMADQFKQCPQAKEIYESTGCPIDAIYPLSKISWIKASGLKVKPFKFISIKEYIFHRFFGEYVADWSIASATGLFDFRRRRWQPAAMETAGIDENELSLLVPPRTVFTRWNPEVLQEIGIPQGTPCVIGGGDGPLASIGVGAIGRGVAAVNVGTSAAARYTVATPEIDPHGRLWTYVVDDGWWVVGGIVSSGGIVYDWFIQNVGAGELKPRDSKKPFDVHEAISDLAASVPPGAEGLLFIPYLGGEQCPVWDPHTTGAFTGIMLGHNRAHLARAVYEGITWSIARVLAAIGDVFEPIEEVRVTGGLATSPTWLKIAADMFGTRIYVPETTEGSALGAAVLAWMALGMSPDIEATKKMGRAQKLVEPDAKNRAFYKRQGKEAEQILGILKSVRS